MLDDKTLEKLIPEIISRLTMMGEEFDYEIEIPSRNALLGIVGGGEQGTFRLVPILQEGSVRRKLPEKIFTLRNEGTIEVAGQVYPHTKIVLVDHPEIELYEWLRSDPWAVPSMHEREVNALLPLRAEPPPLRVDAGGAVRVSKSRINLDLIVEQFENGMTPEAMIRAYDTLELSDVYAVIAYYLRHRDEVRAYLKRRAEEAEALRAKIEAERPRISREELLARRTREKADAPAGQ